MRKLLLVSVALLFSLAGCAAREVKTVEASAPRQLENTGVVRPVAISKVIAKMPRGTKIGTVGTGLACMTDSDNDIVWGRAGRANLTTEELVDVFRQELESAGWPVAGTTDNLFEDYNLTGADLLVAAKIAKLEVNVCYNLVGFGDTKSAIGAGYLEVEWQVYSPRTKKVIGTLSTEGGSKIDSGVHDAANIIVADSFKVATRNLLASDKFYELVKKTSGGASIPSQEPIEIRNSKPNNLHVKDGLDMARKSVVTVRVPGGHGSGFAVGDGFKVITNAHVVRDAKNVTIVTSDGISFTGAVIRVNKERDIALVDLGQVSLKPLHVRDEPLTVGADVYAIGSPLDEKLSGTITKGIYSGNRLMEELAWLQSDVTINPGNSGGPLLDENCHVAGITTLNYGGSETGLNLFVPIMDGFKHLSLSLLPHKLDE